MSQIFAIVGDHSRHMKTQICTVADSSFSSLPILYIVSFNFWRTFHFSVKVTTGRIWNKRLAIFRYVGKIWDGRKTAKSPIVWDFPDIRKLGFLKLRSQMTQKMQGVNCVIQDLSWENQTRKQLSGAKV